MTNCIHGIIVLGLGLASSQPAWGQSGPNQTVPVPPPVKVEPVGPLNLTPLVVEQDGDGYVSKVIVFKDGSRRKHVGLPIGWIAAGSTNEMFLTSPGVPDSRITLRVSSLEAPPKFDPSWIDSTKSLILAGLPGDAKDQRIANVTPDVFNLANWATIEFKASYDRSARKFATGWTFIRLPDKRFLELIYSSPDDKFTKVRTDALQLISGWGLHVEPGAKEIR